MTSFQVRSESSQRDVGTDVLLDWFPDKPRSTVQYGPDFLKNLLPSPVARDLLRLGGAVYCADKIASRAETPDFWTRELALQLPVSDLSRWNGAKEVIEKALAFLSGDQWTIEFVADSTEDLGARPVGTDLDYDVVALFSGGLDSLAGAIDCLEEGKRLVLVGHHDSPLTDNKQAELYAELQSHYGADRLTRRSLWLRPAPARTEQARALPRGEGETSTRARSFLFLSAGVAIADALGCSTPLFVPENGFIGINVPLTPARAGSLSTRTTHPLFMDRMRQLLDLLGLSHPLENPYRLLTKGEAIGGNANRKLLLKLAPRTVSCSHPEAGRWRHRKQGNCGYCYPCLIRRAALHHVGADRSADYSWDALTDADLLRPDWDSGRSLRALTTSLGFSERPMDVLRNGRIPNGEAPLFFDLHQRGRAELRGWLKAGAGKELRRRLV